MAILATIFYALVALFILVGVHEFGHYWVARRCGVRVERFSIGFGPPLVQWQRGETQFVLAALPLGGYVKMQGEMLIGPGQEAEAKADAGADAAEPHRSFCRKPLWQRAAIVLAGPVFNLLLAVVVYFAIFLAGTRGIAPVIGSVVPGSLAAQQGVPANSEIVRVDDRPVATWEEVLAALVRRVGESGQIRLQLVDPALRGAGDIQSYQGYALPIRDWHRAADAPDLLGSLGLVPFSPHIEPVIGRVQAGSAAAAAGLRAGDRIIEMDETAIAGWQQWRDMVYAAPGRSLDLLVERDSEVVRLSLHPQRVVVEGGAEYGRAGVAPQLPEWPAEMLRPRQYGVLEAGAAAVQKTWGQSRFILESLGKLISGQISTRSLGGPVSIAKFAGASAEAGWQQFLSFLALMSIMLGVLNLLPIPMLDGGHLLFYLIEAVKRSPLSLAVQQAAMQAGMALVFGVMLLALYNDFLRL
ncbi:MAG: RIP metalloprotease RseP [Cellvibrionales bacterium]|nr:RIP metalloprotease RseP [Cellvibrionales bacterium]